MQKSLPTAFKEIQRFNQPWLWGVLILTLLVLMGLFGFGLYQQLILGVPWGDRPLSDNGLILMAGATVLFSGVIIYLFLFMRLITEVNAEGLCIRFHPLRRKIVPHSSIRSCESRTYKPIREYGGWGIKYGPSGWAYNVFGNRGVQLILIDGKRILIGSQRCEALEKALKQHGTC
ncbi:MAG: DUF6141 family protein [Gammaproteobacteria bacterium]|nr:DUF6141 family protein [Gammaproteobacteria bacterium]